jgi:hypothetical protein
MRAVAEDQSLPPLWWTTGSGVVRQEWRARVQIESQGERVVAACVCGRGKSDLSTGHMGVHG